MVAKELDKILLLLYRGFLIKKSFRERKKKVFFSFLSVYLSFQLIYRTVSMASCFFSNGQFLYQFI